MGRNDDLQFEKLRRPPHFFRTDAVFPCIRFLIRLQNLCAFVHTLLCCILLIVEPFVSNTYGNEHQQGVCDPRCEFVWMCVCSHQLYAVTIWWKYCLWERAVWARVVSFSDLWKTPSQTLSSQPLVLTSNLRQWNFLAMTKWFECKFGTPQDRNVSVQLHTTTTAVLLVSCCAILWLIKSRLLKWMVSCRSPSVSAHVVLLIRMLPNHEHFLWGVSFIVAVSVSLFNLSLALCVVCAAHW